MTKIYVGNIPFLSKVDGDETVTSVPGRVTRVVGEDLIYIDSPRLGAMVISPEDILGYSGEPLKKIGVFEGANVALTNTRFDKVG
jgi:hypothetical protein